MGIFGTSFNPKAVEDNGAFNLAHENAVLRDDVAHLEYKTQELEESLLKISDAFDNIGFAPLNIEETTALPLKTVKQMAKVSRSMAAMNPFVKRGVKARISYIWGKGVQFDKTDTIQGDIDKNKKKMFSSQAYEELEMAAATDGNVFRAIPLDTEQNTEQEATTLRIPLDQIVDAVSNPEDFEEIWYYKRSFVVRKTDQNGVVTKKEQVKYYASIAYYQKLQRQGKNLPKRWKDAGVDQNFVMQHITVNRQVGWRWGIPDVAAVVFWAAAYKEYLEDNAKLVKAYSRLAWQVKVPTQTAAQGAAAQVMTPPSRDPITGESRDVGGTAVTGMGTTISPTSVSSSQVDFSKGTPLASAIASGLEVSLIVITSDPGSGNRSTAETLDLPTLKAMESRQLLWTEAFNEIFEFWGATESTVTWPQIYNDATKDRIAAIGTADELGRIYPEESRKEILDVLGIAPFKPWDELPNPAEDPKNVYKEEQANIAFERQQESAEAVAKEAEKTGSVVPGQGKSGGIAAKGGAMSTPNEARDNRAKDKNSR